LASTDLELEKDSYRMTVRALTLHNSIAIAEHELARFFRHYAVADSGKLVFFDTSRNGEENKWPLRLGQQR
jgi:glutamine synthetase type III